MSDSPSTAKCERCGSPLSSVDAGLCPGCVFGSVFDLDDDHPIITGQDAGLLAGKFLLGDLIGEGGFGEVFRATQIEPVQREVALKILKPGMDSHSVNARFEAERQALALLDHPRIAKIYDAGETETGRPFFAMELVEGVSLTEYCDGKSLPRGQRLELFTQACDAVHHAHQRGIIHRDIKPSNILVTDEGDLKVIDFGIAKATERLLTEKTVLTEFHQFVGTPAYVSPEQAEMSGRDVDTRSDIYSLGALLYELLTGSPPFDADELRETGLAETLRIIREREPQRPSAFLAKRSASTPEPLMAARVPRDLDWIVMRALEKDPDRRYATAHEFAQDIGRFRGRLPVVARPPSKLYRLGKFVRRNRAASVMALVAGTALVLGSALAFHGLLRAKEEARISHTQAERARAVVRLIDGLFGSADPLIMRGGADYTVRQLLDDYSREFEGKLDDQPEVELSLQRTIGTAYFGLAEYDAAERHLRRGLELAGKIDDYPPEDLFHLQREMAWAIRHQGRYEAARKQLSASRNSEMAAGRPAIETTARLAETHRLLGENERAVELADSIKNEVNDGRSLDLLASVYAAAEDFDLAQLLAERALKFAQQQYGEKSPRQIRPLDTLARIADRRGETGEAIAFAKRAQDLAGSIFGEDHPVRLFAEARVAELELSVSSRPAEVGKGTEKLRSVASRLFERAGEDPESLNPVLTLAAKLFSEGKAEDAREFLTEKLGIDYGALRSGDVVTIDMAGGRIGKIMREGRVKNYIPLIEKSLLLAEKLFGEDATHTAELQRVLGYMYRWEKRHTESEALMMKALAHYRGEFGEAHGTTLDCLLNLAELMWDGGRDSDAEALLFGDLGGTRSKADTAVTLQGLGEHFLNTGRLTEAEWLLDRALAMHRELHGDDHSATLHVLEKVCELEVAQVWIRQLDRGSLLVESYEKSRKVFGEGSIETARALKRLTADGTLLVGVPKTKSLATDQLARAKEANADGEVIELIEQTIAECDRITETRIRWAGENLREAEKAGDSARGALFLRRSAYSEVARGNTEAGLDLVRKADLIDARLPPPTFEHDFDSRVTTGWIYWCSGDRDRSKKTLSKLTREHLLDDRLSSNPRANLLRDFLRPIWDSGGTAEFWREMDAIEDRAANSNWDLAKTEIVLPRGSRWFVMLPADAPPEEWKAPLFEREIIWGRGHAPFNDYYRFPAGRRLRFPTAEAPMTGYFRSTFKIEDPAQFAKLKLRLTRWAGAAIYLNGKEVARHNLAANATHTDASTVMEPGGQLRAHVIEIGTDQLNEGENTLAVEVHRYLPERHLYFDLQVEALRE